MESFSSSVIRRSSESTILSTYASSGLTRTETVRCPASLCVAVRVQKPADTAVTSICAPPRRTAFATLLFDE